MQGTSRRRTGRAAAALTAVLLAGSLSACGAGAAGPVAEAAGPASELNGTDVSDVITRPALSLTDTEGRPFSLQQRPADELTVLFFGYTRCPDVCPTGMADLAAARRQLSDSDRRHLQVAFVTEDPANDTAPVVRRWLNAFDPAFLGLIGGGAATETVLDQLKAPRTETTATPPEGVTGPLTGPTVQHTGSVYAFYGDQVLVYTDRTSPRDYAADFHRVLAP